VARTLGALLAERRAAVVGRGAELAALRGLFDDDGPVVAVVHGIAGSGKSSLLRAFRAEAAARDVPVVAVDARAVEPTPAGFLAAIPADLGDDRVVIAIDTAEHLRLLDGWLRQSFFPSLPANARVVWATRDAPGAVWRASFGELLCSVPLEPLSPGDAAEVLLGAGLDESQAEWVNRFVRGHPLSLQLAASAVRERPEAPEDAVLPTVVQELAALWLGGIDAETREALDATCVLRRVTLSLLGAVLPASDGAFERLRALPFVELGREGLVVHDTVRECVAALLRATDPVRHREYRRAAWRQIRSELDGTAGAARWSSLADMIHLVDQPLVREAFFPSSVQHYAVETARPEDRDAILEIVARHETADHRSLIREWWDALPGAFRVARSPRGEAVAFTILCELSEIPQRLLTRDAVSGPWRRHLRTHPVPRDQRVLVVRLALAYATGSAASPCLAALLRDMERASLEAGPALRRVYTYTNGDELLSQLAPLGFERLPGAADLEVDGLLCAPVVLDLGPESIAGWLSGLAARDLPAVGAALDEAARELVVDGRRIKLSRLECDVLRYLREREGQVVARDALLRDVWGYEWTGGSNVVDVAVSGLRRKLGSSAGALETVRGVGYRLRPL
jgi:Transcriptional regulatory protein, C terminal